MSLFIRPPTLEDVELLGALHHRCWVETYSPILPQTAWLTITVESRVQQWREVLTDPQPGHVQCTAWLDHEIVGFSASGPPAEGEPRHLFSIYVLSARHGTGIGQHLLDATIGDEPAFLWVASQNARARAFYRRNRFGEDGRTDTLEVAEGAIIPVVRMQR